MSQADKWTIVFYREGAWRPVLEFIEALDLKTRARLEWSIEQLRLRNVRATEPLVKHIDGKIWELRDESRGTAYRIFYFIMIDRRIVLLHGFRKTTKRTPRREIEVARRRIARIDAARRGT